jgi:hypothetical protein
LTLPNWNSVFTSLTSKLPALVTKYAEQLVRDAIAKVVETVIKKIVTQIIASAAIPFGGLIVDTIIQPLLDDLDTQIDSLTGNDGLLDDPSGALKDAVLSALESKLQDMLNGVLADALMHEVGGPLIWAGGTLDVGYDASGNASSPVIASGLFLSNGNIRLNAANAIGVATSLTGDVTCSNFYYNPYFSKVSLFVPKPSPSDWIARAVEFTYGSDYGAGTTVDINAGVPAYLTSEGWNR